MGKEQRKSVNLQDILPFSIPESVLSPPDIPLRSEKTHDLKEEEVEDRRATRKLREEFGKKAYKVAINSLLGWAVLLFMYALFRAIFKIELFSDNVLIAITSAVTLNVFAAYLGVIRGLFPSNKHY
jgi:hypothetical protein